MKKLLAIYLLLVVSVLCSAQEGNLQQDLALKYLVRLPAKQQSKMPVIILLHGYGSDERDLFGLRTVMPGNYLVVSVRAPHPLSNGGYQWYNIVSKNGIHDGDKHDVDNSRSLIAQFVGQIVTKYKADAANVYVTGFSQGAIMSYEVGLVNPEKVKGIGILSGKLLESEKPLIRKSDALRNVRIFISHGTADDRISFADGKAGNDYLVAVGLKPEFHAYAGMAHSITQEVLTDFIKWLK